VSRNALKNVFLLSQYIQFFLLIDLVICWLLSGVIRISCHAIVFPSYNIPVTCAAAKRKSFIFPKEWVKHGSPTVTICQ